MNFLPDNTGKRVYCMLFDYNVLVYLPLHFAYIGLPIFYFLYNYNFKQIK